MDDAEALLAAVMAWGRERSDVRAVLAVGSRARADSPADRWSDTDVALVVDDPGPYLASSEWLDASGRPDQAAFAQLTNDFWYHLVWAAKKLRRGELWIATQACDCHLKGLVVALLAWQAKAADPQADTWHGGRFLERWADPGALAELGGTYAGYDAAEVGRALWATAELFQRLERDCAERLGLALSVQHQQVRRRLGEILGPAR